MKPAGYILQAEGLSRSFGPFRALDNMSLDLPRGDIHAIIGPNGAGKSTFLNVVSGLLKPTRGDVIFEGRRISSVPAHKRAAMGMARSFQITSIFSGMSVAANVQLAILAQRGETWNPLRIAGRRHWEAALTILERVGIAHMADRNSGELAAGDRKRVEFAIALAAQPKVLLLDEPTAGMSNAERRIVVEILRKLAKQENIGILFTEHDIDMVFENADCITVMHQGQMIARGTAAEMRSNSRVKEVYTGEDGDA